MVKPTKKNTSPKSAKGKEAVKPAAKKKPAVTASKPAPKASEEEPAPVKRVLSASQIAFFKKQKARLLQLRDGMLDSMTGVARDNLRSRAEGSEASAFGMHQADAGSDAYDRDFALSLLSQEQDALYEIDEALKRIEIGTYGICEMCDKSIPHARLEAIPFARCTVDCQSKLEKERKLTRTRQPVTSLFGLTDDDTGGDGDEDEPVTEPKE